MKTLGLPSAAESASSGLPAAGPASQHEVGVTRRAIVRLLAQHGSLTAPVIAEHLELSTVGVRRHLVELVESGDAVVVQRKPTSGRGRPPKVYQLTPQGQDRLGNAYDELAKLAFGELQSLGGDAAVAALARTRARAMVSAIGLDAPDFRAADAQTKAERLAQALTSAGYEASTTRIGSGVQLCQHHCPVLGVAADFPALCEAETAVFSELLGTHVQRLATIAQGNCVCTTHIPTLAASSDAPPEPLSARNDQSNRTLQ
ncbi:putative transcriptional regulator [Segniliparus rotundus DSM 44985]|uniref:Putative transcriptional regulator n=1 Tax=Segniliparus rotundus (strain ATCC BAA-972 / CDC 1076 / CIP 108378 / DSM 44985 / JCM 13578) TaxID=640132 RepID=D6ZAP3_SEGRD|nr:metalloregulator ArsR/SmtB family transcription factor [Segniliparus rotundus]ADG98779.1 putative transcriptional regulator [Segniliparus rotundus DSM 44985]